jgi:hypothetical protein
MKFLKIERYTLPKLCTFHVSFVKVVRNFYAIFFKKRRFDGLKWLKISSIEGALVGSKKSYLKWLLLLCIYFFLPISVSTVNAFSGVVYNDLRGFELEAEKVGFASQRLGGAYFESIRLENKDNNNVILNHFTEDDHFSLYKSENVQQRGVVKTGLDGKFSFSNMYRASGDFPYDYAMEDLELPSIYESDDKNVLIAQDTDADAYLSGMNQGAPVSLEVGFYLIHEIWAPIGDFSPAFTNKHLYRRYDRTDTVWIVHLYLDNNGNPRAEYRAGKFKHKTSGGSSYYVLENVDGLFSLSLNVDERIKVMLDSLDNKLYPEFDFKITKRNPDQEIISSSSAKFGVAKMIEDDASENLRKLLAEAEREGNSRLPTNYFSVASTSSDKRTEDGILHFGNLDRNKLYVVYELEAPEGYVRAEQKAYFVYFDKSDNYAFENIDGLPIVFEGEITRGADGYADKFLFKKHLSSQFDLKAIRFTLDSVGAELKAKYDDFVIYIPRYRKNFNNGLEEWQEINLSKYVTNLQGVSEFSNFEFTANDSIGVVSINTHGYMVSDLEEKLKKLLRKGDNYLTMLESSKPSGIDDWLDIEYHWIEKILDSGAKEYLIDPNSYVVGVHFLNSKSTPGGFLPMTGKIFTKPIVWIIIGIFVAIIAIIIYKKTYRNNEEL